MHSILSFTHEDYGRATSLKSLAAQLSWGSSSGAIPEEYYLQEEQLGKHPDTLLTRRANATMLMLARNSDVNDAVRSVRRLEDRFNKKFGYPWLFLNEEPFSEEFKTCVRLALFLHSLSFAAGFHVLGCAMRVLPPSSAFRPRFDGGARPFGDRRCTSLHRDAAIFQLSGAA